MLSAIILLTKFLPVPVQPCKERARGFLAFSLLRKPFTAFTITLLTRCCPKSFLSRFSCRAGEQDNEVRGETGRTARGSWPFPGLTGATGSKGWPSWSQPAVPSLSSGPQFLIPFLYPQIPHAPGPPSLFLGVLWGPLSLSPQDPIPHPAETQGPLPSGSLPHPPRPQFPIPPGPQFPIPFPIPSRPHPPEPNSLPHSPIPLPHPSTPPNPQTPYPLIPLPTP